MDNIIILFIILLLLAIIGVMIYFYIEFEKFKKSVEEAQKEFVNTEYVDTQINNLTEDSINPRFEDIQTNFETINGNSSNNHQQIVDLALNVDDNHSNIHTLFGEEYPNEKIFEYRMRGDNYDVELLKHTNAVSGMNINNILTICKAGEQCFTFSNVDNTLKLNHNNTTILAANEDGITLHGDTNIKDGKLTIPFEGLIIQNDIGNHKLEFCDVNGITSNLCLTQVNQ
jgi:hypothetical protein